MEVKDVRIESKAADSASPQNLQRTTESLSTDRNAAVSDGNRTDSVSISLNSREEA